LASCSQADSEQEGALQMGVTKHWDGGQASFVKAVHDASQHVPTSHEAASVEHTLAFPLWIGMAALQEISGMLSHVAFASQHVLASHEEASFPEHSALALRNCISLLQEEKPAHVDFPCGIAVVATVAPAWHPAGLTIVSHSVLPVLPAEPPHP